MLTSRDKELNDWKEEIEKARKQRHIFMVHWQYWEQVYDDNLWGNQRFEDATRKTPQNKQNFRPQINELESIVMNILPKIHFYAPIFEVTSHDNNPLNRFSAYIYELLAGVLYEKLGMFDNIGDVIIDTLILGGGVHKVGYAYEVETSGYQLGDATAGDPEITNDMVFSGYVSPKDVLWDYRVTSWRDKRWFAEEIIKPVDEVKKSNLYSARDLKGNLTLSDDIEGIKRQIQENRKGDLVRLVEIHDLVNSKIVTIADGHEKILRKDDDYSMELYDPLNFIPTRPRRFWGKSIAQSIEEHMINLSKVYHYMMSHSRGAGLTKLMGEASLLTPEVIRKLESSNDFELIAMDGVTQGEPLRELKLTGTGAEWYNNYAMVDSIIRYLSGVTQQERGRHETGVATAFEVARLAEASDVRNRYRILMVNRFTANVMSKILRIVSDNFPAERIADMVGLPAEEAFKIMPFDRMYLNVKYGSTAVEARREQLNRVIMFSQLAAQFGLQVNPQGVLELISGALGLELNENMLLLAGGGTTVSDAQGRPPAASRSNIGNFEGAALPNL